MPPGEHFALLDNLGATCNATTFFDRTNYFETVPTSALDLVLWLEADRMGGLLAALDQRNLDAQREVVRNERRQMMDNVPYGTSFERMFAATFPQGHQYHHEPMGSMSDLQAASLEDVRRFFTTHYHPGNAVLGIVGDVDPGDAIARVKRYFDGIPAGERSPEVAPQPIDPRSRRAVLAVDDEPVPFPAAFVMWPVPVDGTDASNELALAARILGGGMSSRLFDHFVRNRQIANQVSAGLLRLVGGHSVLYLEIFGTEDVTAKRLLDEVRDEMTSFLATIPTPVELRSAQAQETAAFQAETQDLAGRADSLSHGVLMFNNPRHDTENIDRMGQVSPQSVSATANTWLDPSWSTALTYTPAGGGSNAKERQ